MNKVDRKMNEVDILFVIHRFLWINLWITKNAGISLQKVNEVDICETDKT